MGKNIKATICQVTENEGRDQSINNYIKRDSIVGCSL